jgi:AcrR family transcriptional regulator
MAEHKNATARATGQQKHPSRPKPKKVAGGKGQKARITRAEQRERSRTVILATARRLFAERGFDGVRVDDIAVQAGVQRSLLIYYFKSKEDLWRLVVQEVAESFNAALHRNIQSYKALEPRAALRKNLIDSLNAFLDEPDFPRLLVKEGGTEGQRIQWLVENFNYVDVVYGDPGLKRYIGTSVMRDILFSVLLSMAALGPLMEASLSRAAGRVQSGIVPMKSETKEEIVSILMQMILAFENDPDLRE